MRTTLWILAISVLALGFSGSVAAQPPCQPMCDDVLDRVPDTSDLPALGPILELLPFALAGMALARRVHH